MVSIKIDDLSSVKPFDPHGDPSSVCRRWQRWMKRFSLYADSKGLIIQADKDDNKIQRRALLLYSAGEDVQEIFETLVDTGGIKDYGISGKALNDYFIPKVNSTYQNHVFRSMEQHDGETVATDVGMWAILDDTLNVLLEEKPAISVDEQTTLVPSVKQ